MDAFIGEIRPFAFGFAPSGWMQCNGQQLMAQQYAALFSLISNTYGGNGQSTFNLPNLQGNVLVGQGQLTNGQMYAFGANGGQTTVTLSPTTVPPHTHNLNVGTVTPNALVAHGTTTPNTNSYISNIIEVVSPTNKAGFNFVSAAPTQALNPGTLSPYIGQFTPHSNMQPNIVINYCICVSNGEYPARPN